MKYYVAEKMVNKKAKAKNSYPTNKEKILKRSRAFYRNISEDEKNKKEFMLILEYKYIRRRQRRKKGIYEKLLLYKKKLFNHLINRVEELERVCVSN